MKKNFKEKMTVAAQASVAAMEIHLTHLFRGKEAWVCYNDSLSYVWQVAEEEFVGFMTTSGYTLVPQTVEGTIVRVDLACERNEIKAFAEDVNGENQLLFILLGNIDKHTEIGKILF